MVVYLGICSLMGSLTVISSSPVFSFNNISLSETKKHFDFFFSSLIQVMGVKAVAIALKLSFLGSNQFIYFETWFFTTLVIIFCFMQMIYLNKVFL